MTSFRWESSTFAFLSVWPGGSGSLVVDDVSVSMIVDEMLEGV